MKHLTMAFVFLGLAVSSCAFKESAAEKQQEVSRRMDGRLLKTSLTWDGLDKAISLPADSFIRVADVWTRDPVITLPVDAPETLTLNLQLAHQPQDVKEWSASSFVTTGDDLNERALGAQILESTPADIGTAVKVRLTGTNTLFVRDREQRMYLTLSLRNPAGEDVEKFRLVVSTPPSRLTVLKDELVTGRFPDGLQRSLTMLSSQAESRMLVRRVLLRNDSFESVRITVPFKSRGKFSIRGVRFSAETKSAPHATLYTQKQEELNWDQDSDVYIYPLSEEIVKTWTSFSQADMNALILIPGATIDLGFYASDAVTAQLVAHPISNPEVRVLASNSVARCNPGAYISTPDPGWCDLFDHVGGWHFPSETIALMKQEIQAMRACLDSGRNVDLCNRAALIDEDLDNRKMPHPANGILWMVYYGCSYNSTCPGDPSHVCEAHHGWSWSTVNSNFQVGIQTAPVTVDWSEKQISLLARFSPAAVSNDGEARSILLSPSGTQIRE